MNPKEIIYNRLGKITILRKLCKEFPHKYSEGVLDVLDDEEKTLKEILDAL
ncbi:hypothetical protein ACTS94_05075 [Empedobacter falsenii]